MSRDKIFVALELRSRSRNAIEEELEILYEAYYEELEQYANHQQQYVSSGRTITPPPGPGPFPGSVELDKNGAVVGHPVNGKPHGARTKMPPAVNGRKPPIKQPPDSEFDDDEGEEDYEDDEDDEEYEEEDDE